MSGSDIHSHARPHEARVRHLDLDIHLDFSTRTVRGRARLHLERAQDATEVVLDVRDLQVFSVTASDGADLPFQVGEPDPVMGSALTVHLPRGLAEVVVDYATTPAGAALVWLEPRQTAGGEHPFVFSQGHAILTRSWIPTQDSLGARQSFNASVTVPADLRVAMSAENLTPDGVLEGDVRRFDFRMPHPVPTYLIALAAGDLAFREVGPRTGVFAESTLIGAAHHEFLELESMLEAAERIAGPYRWGRADVLVLPPSFPFGGMENPRLTFVSPGVIVGDRSLTTIVVHELAHAWSGNLVTPATWADFWLNEGFTVYLELRINEVLHGADHAAMLEVYGYRELCAEVERQGADSPDTALRLDLAGRDPAVAVTVVPYVKGAALLRVVERAVGRVRFDAFLQDWFRRHAFGEASAETFVEELRDRLFGGDAEALQRLEIERWIFAPGLPSNAVEPASGRLQKVEAAADAFASGVAARSLPVDGWVPQEWRHFLNVLPRAIAAERLRDLDERFGLSRSGNSEILFPWLRLAALNAYEPALPSIERFLTTQGRGKFVRPLFSALLSSDWGTGHARRIYVAARPLYHSLLTDTLDPLLH